MLSFLWLLMFTIRHSLMFCWGFEIDIESKKWYNFPKLKAQIHFIIS